jgi:hypothetical protein
MIDNKDWLSELCEFCDRYDMKIEHLAKVLNTPKVIPMIRGKSFEFSVKDRLDIILPETQWEISNPYMNAQTGLHDIDVEITNRTTHKKYSVECKLAKKGSFKFHKGNFSVQVKCMRSRTLGVEVAKKRAEKSGEHFEILTTHNDQYRTSDFNLVITSIGNAFYETNEEGVFFWSPKASADTFFKLLGLTGHQDTFNKMYVARSYELSSSTNNGISCTRKKCTNKTNCSFIPNYPIIRFDPNTGKPLHPWYPIEEIETVVLNSQF